MWTDSLDASGPGELLTVAPHIRWVQLPFADIDRFRSVVDALLTLLEPVRGGCLGVDVTVVRRHPGPLGAARVVGAEPLPIGHPLWNLDNCLITPHTANTQEMAKPLVADRIRRNVERFAVRQPLLSLVDPPRVLT